MSSNHYVCMRKILWTYFKKILAQKPELSSETAWKAAENYYKTLKDHQNIRSGKSIVKLQQFKEDIKNSIKSNIYQQKSISQTHPITPKINNSGLNDTSTTNSTIVSRTQSTPTINKINNNESNLNSLTPHSS